MLTAKMLFYMQRLCKHGIQQFLNSSGSVDGTDAASNFLRRFEENAAASGWTDDEAKRKFRLAVGRTVQDWYNQLRADERSTWKALRASFVREYILSPVPKQEVYYTMRQKEDETIREYLFRFNAAATKIGLKYDTVRKHFVDHLRCFCNSLADPSQAKWISSMRFASMDDLKEYLNDQRHTEALREHRSQRGATQAGNNQRQERTKAPRVNHLDAVTSTDMAKLAAAATDSVRAEIFAAKRVAKSAVTVARRTSSWTACVGQRSSAPCLPALRDAASQGRPVPDSPASRRAEGVPARAGHPRHAQPGLFKLVSPWGSRYPSRDGRRISHTDSKNQEKMKNDENPKTSKNQEKTIKIAPTRTLLTEFEELFEVVRGWKRRQQERAVTASVEEAIKNEDRTENRRDLDAANHVGFLKV
ncbi:hypothetical protein LEN26_010002 [Aphanomyces euteiches]|nr:hypothetical protein LEN26_010002 [Aphanomyces euteiches]